MHKLGVLFAGLAVFVCPHLGHAGDYGKFNFGKEISKQKLQQALQAMVDKTYLVGFRTLGDSEDLFHGHVIFDGNENSPKILLYHTQERANLYDRYEPQSPYAYVDKTKRNWVQHLDTLEVEDANLYRYNFTKPSWCLGEEAFTINYDMLDPQKLGFNSVVRETSQINFYKTKCDKKVNDEKSDKISVTLPSPSNQTVCLQLYDKVPQSKYYSAKFFKYGSNLAKEEDKGTIHTNCSSTITE